MEMALSTIWKTRYIPRDISACWKTPIFFVAAANQHPYVFLSDALKRTGWHDLQFYRKCIHRIESYPRYAAFADLPCFSNLKAFEQTRSLTLSTTSSISRDIWPFVWFAKILILKYWQWFLKSNSWRWPRDPDGRYCDPPDSWPFPYGQQWFL